MRTATISLSALIAALCLAAGGAAFAHSVGAVLKVKRDAYGTPRDAARETKSQGDTISDHELLETDSRSQLTVQLADGSQMSLGANSKAVVEAFEYRPAQSGGGAAGNATIFMRLGKLAYQTGDMPKGMTRIETPSADVTLHGTDIKVQVNARGYTHIDVEEGSIQVRSKFTGEATEIGAGESVSILPEGIRDGHVSIDRPAAYSVENRRNDRGGASDGNGRSGGSESGDSGSDSGSDSDGGGASGG